MGKEKYCRGKRKKEGKMGNAKNCLLWEQFEQLNGVSECKHCKAQFRGNPSAARLTNHLLGLENRGIRICKEVPADVKEALADGSSSNNVTDSISTFAPQQNVSAHSVPEGCISERLEDNMEVDFGDDLCEELDTQVPHHVNDAIVCGSNNRPQLEPRSSNNEATNLTSAQNALQMGESIQDPVVQGEEHDNLAGVHNREDMYGILGDNFIEGWEHIIGIEISHEPCEELGTQVRYHADHAVAYGSNNITQLKPSSSDNDVTNLTSAPQRNNGFENPVQIGESIQDPMVQGAEHANLDGFHNREDMTGCNTTKGHDAENQTEQNSFNIFSCWLTEMETTKIWDQFELLDGDTKCRHCRAEFKKPSATRLRNHLLGVKDGVIHICTKVPDDVKKALDDGSNKRRRIELGSSSNDVTNSISASVSQQKDDASVNPVPEGCILEEGSMGVGIDEQHCDDLDTQMSYHADHADPAACPSNNIPQLEPSSSNNEVTNQVQGEERMQEEVQGTDENFFEGSEQMGDDMRAPETNEEPLLTTNLVGQAFKTNMNIVWEWLMRDEVSSIGIHGMGGVGKTTLVTHIHNRIQKNRHKFNNVYWVTVSQDFSIERLQNLIAEAISLNFENEKNELKRAAKLSKGLGEKCKFVLILDDLWNHFDVKKVGIPTGVDGCKLIVTTRSLEVCRRTNCQEKLKVEPLLENEPWELFRKTLGHDLAPNIELIARSITKECDGLPLGIFTLAGSMREVDDIHEWNNALRDLHKAEVREDDMEPEVFRVLRYSYTRLNDPRLKQCFLYCALYPEDFDIDKDELIEHLVVERIIERADSRVATNDKGRTMLNKLVNVGLLEPTCGFECVKMHDLIRDMAIQIMRECSPSLVKAGKQMRSLPEDIWCKNTVRVSLMQNGIEEIPSDCSPKCPELSTLFLCDNYPLKSIPECFFFQMKKLMVLNLSHTMIKRLPESIALLNNLTALFLTSCRNLIYVPSLRELGALEVLDLFDCGKLKEVPEGLESLSNLNYLNFLWSGVMKLPSGMLRTRLVRSHLQFLAFQYSSETGGVKEEDLRSLSNLETLHLNFHDQGDFNNYIHSQLSMHTESRQLIKHISLMVGSTQSYKGLICPRLRHGQYGQNLHFWGCILSKEVLVPKHIQDLAILDASILDGRGLCLKNAIALKEFAIAYCKEIEYLFYLSSSPSLFQTLETLWVEDIEKLRGLFSREGDDGVIPIHLLPKDTFSSLKSFKLLRCDNMEKLFPSGLVSNLRNLEKLDVYHCSKMEEIIASEEEEEDEEQEKGSNTFYTLPNLRLLNLEFLPKLKSICSARLKCDSLLKVVAKKCPKLRKIPISFSLSSVEEIHFTSEEWQKSRKWGNSEDTYDLQPKVYIIE